MTIFQLAIRFPRLAFCAIRVGWGLVLLTLDQWAWSERTFGTRKSKGPIGTLKHLSKEALEAAAKPSDLFEYADCLILLLDAIWRADFSLLDLIRAARIKMIENKARKWPKPNGDEPVEHVKEVGKCEICGWPCVSGHRRDNEQMIDNMPYHTRCVIGE